MVPLHKNLSLFILIKKNPNKQIKYIWKLLQVQNTYFFNLLGKYDTASEIYLLHYSETKIVPWAVLQFSPENA